jgi:1-acyl-sn-glycerol-3-phosphate acyltransferase
MERVTSAVKVVAGLFVMAVTVAIQGVVLLVLLPSRRARIVACNYWGKIVGPIMMWLTGCALTIKGSEHLDASRPAIYISNHTSIIDVFLAIFLSPLGTVGVAKRGVVYYPFFGQMYLLSGHLRIDRGKTGRAKESLRALGELVKSQGLSIYIWPEGTRSRDGRLRPFKKGVVHLAVQTGLPIVPILVHGAHKSWEKERLVIRGVPVSVDVCPPIDTSEWRLETLSEHLSLLHDVYERRLGDDQRPRPEPTTSETAQVGAPARIRPLGSM